MDHSNFDLLSHIEDEIALEGLDGITLEGLWLRLSLRPQFAELFTLDNESKAFLWTLIAQDPNIFFYCIPIPRAPLKIFNRYELLDAELGIIIEAEEEYDDIYPFCPIFDEENGIKGSCHTYYLRTDITESASLLTLDEASATYGNSLVLVASQHLREKSLGINQTIDKLYDLNPKQFGILELIGRSRYLGEVTQGKNSLARINMPPKTLFYLRKRLIKMNLMKKQIHRQKSTQGQLFSSSLLNLTRFYTERKSKFHIMIERAIEIIRESPHQLCPIQKMRDMIELPFFSSKKLLKNPEFLKFIKTVNAPHRTLFPDASEVEWKFKNKDEERTLRCLTLVNPSTMPEDVGFDDNIDSDDDDEEESFPGILDQSNLIYGQSILRQAYQAVENAGPGGMTQNQLAKLLGQSKLDSRTICRNLLRRNVIHIIRNDEGKQRTAVFISNKFAKTGYMMTEFQEERRKIISMIKQTNESGDASSLPVPSMSKTSESCDLGDSVMNEEMADISPSKSHNQCEGDSQLYQGSESIELDLTEENSVIETQVEVSKDICVPVEFENSSFSRYYNLTTRLIKRANLIIQTVKEEKVVSDLVRLWKSIKSMEVNERFEGVMDRKSFHRLIDNLTKSGFIRNFLVRFRSINKTKSIKIIVDPSIDLDDPLIKDVIDHNKAKFMATETALSAPEKSPTKLSHVSSPMKRIKKEEQEYLDDRSVDESMKELKQMQFPIMSQREQEKTMKKRQENMLKSLVGPKFVRLQEIHILLYYMIYGYSGDCNLDQDEAWNSMVQEHRNSSLISESRTDYPRIYSPTCSWKTFISPLPKHTRHQRPGWAFVVDFLLRLPLCKFVRIIKVSQKSELLQEMLNPPLKQHLLIKHLDPELRKFLLQGRRYVNYIMEFMNRLCYMGLTQYGEQVTKEKDQIFIYLNRNGTLIDTTVSGPGYHQITTDKEYIRKQYTFHQMHDLTQYWYDLWTICMHTPLGGHACVEGKKITIQILQKKPQIIESMKPQTILEAYSRDVGYIPGDGRGAGGLDSAMFSHLKRNWSYISRSPTLSLSTAVDQNGDNKGSFLSNWGDKNYIHYLKNVSQPISNEVKATKRLIGIKTARLSLYKPKLGEKSKSAESGQANTQSPKRKLENENVENTQGEADQSGTVKKFRKGTYQREIKVRTKLRVRRPYYDEEDRAALRRMNKLRVEWSSSEDSFLILCKVASSFLYPNRRCQMIGFQTVRDLLHQRFPESRNKTSRACQRRINYILKNSTTEDNVAIFLEEVKQDRFLSEKYKSCKMTLKEGRENDNGQKEFFRGFIEALIHKFGSSGSRSGPDLPDSLEEFDAKFNLIRAASSLKTGSKVTEITCLSDIDYYVVYALIYSSLCTKQDRESWAYQLYLAYQKYPQSLLNSVLTALRESQMISYKKSYNRSKYVRTCLPLSASPFQLSYTFIYLFNHKYQYDIFHECWSLTKKLLGFKKQAILSFQASRKSLPSKGISSDATTGQTNNSRKDGETLGACIKEEMAIDLSFKSSETDPVQRKLKKRRKSCGYSKGKRRRVSEEADFPIMPCSIMTKGDTVTSEVQAHATGSITGLIKQPEMANETNLQTNGYPIVIGREGGFCTAIISLMTLKRITFEITIPEQIIMIEDSSSVDQSFGSSIMQRKKEHEEMSGKPYKPPEGLKSPLVYDEDIYSNELRDPLEEMATTDSVDSRREIAPNNRDDSVTQETSFVYDKYTLKHSSSSSSTALPSKIQTINSSNSRLALHVMREHLSSDPARRPSTSTDNMIVNACDIACNLRAPFNEEPPLVISSQVELSDFYLPLSEQESKRALDKRKKVVWAAPLLLVDKLVDNLRATHSVEYLDLLRSVHLFVESAKEIGVTAKMIKNEFSICRVDPMKVLHNLVEANLVWKMGVATRRWISAYFCKSWTIHTNKIPRAIAKSMEATRIQGIYEVTKNPEDVTSEANEDSTSVGEDNEPVHEDDEPDVNNDTSKDSQMGSSTRRVTRSSSKNTSEDSGTAVKAHHLRLIQACKSQKFRKDLEVSFRKEEAALKMEQSSEYEEIDVVVRPWVRLNGCINRRVMDRLLGSILLFIMENPAVSAKRIGDKFWPALQPAHTYELIETLIDLKCVERFKLAKSHPVTLFSDPQVLSIENVEDFDFDEEFIHEATIDAVLKLSIFIGDKKYMQDFLETCR